MGEMNSSNILVGKPVRMILLGRSRRRWEDNNRIDLEETGREGVSCMHLG
jgi:hypothetical protein